MVVVAITIIADVTKSSSFMMMVVAVIIVIGATSQPFPMD